MDEHMEIERRFLVDGREEKPWRQHSDVFQIEQYYTVGDWLSVNELTLMFEGDVFTDITPTERDHLASTASWTTRLRRRNGQFILTYKARISDDTSLELEWSVEEGMAQRLLAKGPFPSVSADSSLTGERKSRGDKPRMSIVLCSPWVIGSRGTETIRGRGRPLAGLVLAERGRLHFDVKARRIAELEWNVVARRLLATVAMFLDVGG